MPVKGVKGLNGSLVFASGRPRLAYLPLWRSCLAISHKGLRPSRPVLYLVLSGDTTSLYLEFPLARGGLRHPRLVCLVPAWRSRQGFLG
eukprot:1796429-Amphidinium_carterae.2